MTEINRKTERGVRNIRPAEMPEPIQRAPLDETKEILRRFNSDIRIRGGRLQIPVFPTDPPSCQVGEVALIGGQHKTCVPPELGYDAQTANFTVGLILTGGTSGATGLIVYDRDGGATGTLGLINVVGIFQDNETITDSGSGSATVNGPISSSSNQWIVTGTQS